MLQISVAQLYDDNRDKLGLAWLGGKAGGATRLRRDSTDAAALVGHLNLIHPNRVQVLGNHELALELISRGHGLVADDVVDIARIAASTLECRCPPVLKDFLEVRGLGVLNIRTIFGETAVRPKMNLRLIVHLDRPGTGEAERLPLHELSEDILGVTVRKVVIPVAAGRNLAVLLEAAVRDYILQLRGIHSTAEFMQRQQAEMKKG